MEPNDIDRIESADPGGHPGAARSSRRPMLLGAVGAAAALVAVLVGIGTVAGAADDPQLDDGAEDTPADDTEYGPRSHDLAACPADALSELWIEAELDEAELDEAALDEAKLWIEAELDEAELDEATEACVELVPEESMAEYREWEEYEECIDDQLAGSWPPFDESSEEDLWGDAEGEAFETAWVAAEQACGDVLLDELSERLEVEAEAIEAFETCLAEAGLGDELHEDQEMPPVVTIETADGLYVVEFGSATGSVAISGDADGVSVTTSGGVSVLDEADLEAEWRAFEAAHELCEELLATE